MEDSVRLSDEKHRASASATIPTAAEPGIYRPEVDTSNVDEQKLMRRIDFRLIPWLAILYLLSSMDRNNIGNAKVRSSSYLHHESSVTSSLAL